jgi:uncharacterized small protein (DUF1192 family)
LPVEFPSTEVRSKLKERGVVNEEGEWSHAIDLYRRLKEGERKYLATMLEFVLAVRREPSAPPDLSSLLDNLRRVGIAPAVDDSDARADAQPENPPEGAPVPCSSVSEDANVDSTNTNTVLPDSPLSMSSVNDIGARDDEMAELRREIDRLKDEITKLKDEMSEEL